jgi:hypothetical protein
LFNSWLQKKSGRNSPGLNSAKRAILSQRFVIWHSGNVTAPTCQPMSVLNGSVDFRRRKKRAPRDGVDYSRRTKFWQEPGAWAERAFRNSNRTIKTQLLWQNKLDSLE